MGFFDRIFSSVLPKSPETEPTPATPPIPEPEPEPVTAEAAVTAVTGEPVAEESPAEPAAPTAAPPAKADDDAPAAEPAAPVAAEPAEPAEPDVIGTEAAEAAPVPPRFDAHLQKRLDTYFARLRLAYPDGCVVRLNTGNKKLAERGAELRRLIGYEGRLDDFFALGGFTYRRSTGGRPRLSEAQTATVEERLRERFPEDVPTVLAVQQADNRLYLDLRAAARLAGCTVGDYLQQFKA